MARVHLEEDGTQNYFVFQPLNKYFKVIETEKKVTDHNYDKYITSPEFNTLAADVFNARLAQANLVTKTDFDAKL